MDDDPQTEQSMLWAAVDGVPDGRWQPLVADALAMGRLAVKAGEDPEVVIFDARTRAFLAGDLDRARVLAAVYTRLSDQRVLAEIEHGSVTGS